MKSFPTKGLSSFRDECQRCSTRLAFAVIGSGTRKNQFAATWAARLFFATQVATLMTCGRHLASACDYDREASIWKLSETSLPKI